MKANTNVIRLTESGLENIITESIAQYLLTEGRKADGIIDGDEIIYSSSNNTIPLFYDEKINKAFVGNFGRSHRQDLGNDDDLILGRYIIKNNILDYWEIKPTVKIINASIDAIENTYDIKVDKSALRIVVNDETSEGNHKLVNYDDYLSKYLTQDYFSSEKFKKDRELHLTSAEEKRRDPNMSGYLKTRSQNIGKKLRMSNDKEMSMAEWNALHRLSEQLEKCKTLITEGDNQHANIHNIVKLRYNIFDGGNKIAVQGFDKNGKLIFYDYNLAFSKIKWLFGVNVYSEIQKVGNEGVIDNIDWTSNNGLPFLEMEDNETIEAALKEIFGTREYNPQSDAGYISLDGSFIPLGQVQHLDMEYYLNGIDNSYLLYRGYIRVSNRFGEACIQLSKEPNFNQKKTLYKVIGSAKVTTVDINGASMSYRFPEPKIVINQINRYFNEGTKLS